MPRRLLLAVAMLSLAVPASAAAAPLTWQGPQQVAPPGSSEAHAAIADDGEAVLVYTDHAGQLRASIRPEQGTFGEAAILSRRGSNAHVTAAGDGSAVATWSSGGQIFAAIRPVGGSFAPRVVLGSDGAGRPLLAMNHAGAAVVAWGASGGVSVARRSAGGTAFAAPVTLPGADVTHAQLGIDGAGNVLVVWEAQTHPSQAAPSAVALETRSADLPAGAAQFTPPTVVSDGQLPELTVGADGTAVIRFGGGAPPQYRVRAPGGTWGPVEYLAGGDQSPAVAVADDGRVELLSINAATRRAQRRTRTPDGRLSTPQDAGPANGPTATTSLGLFATGALALWQTPQLGEQRLVHVAGGASLQTPGLTLTSLTTARSGRAIALADSDHAQPYAWIRDRSWPTEPRRPATGVAIDTTPPIIMVGVVAAHLRRADTPLKLAMVTGDEPPRILITGTARARRGGRTADIPAHRFTLTPGTPRLVAIRLPRTARHVLAHGGTVRLRLRATDPAGNARVTRFTFTIG